MKTSQGFMTTLLTLVALTFLSSSFAQETSPQFVVRIIYFIPNDREPRQNMDTHLVGLIQLAQERFADLMENQGFSRKTFRVESDSAGKVVVHHVRGQFNDAYYQNPASGSWIVWEEIEEQFDTSSNIYLLVLDISSEFLDGTGDYTGGVAGRGTGDSLSGKALVTASDSITAIHELYHTFGLHHDLRSEADFCYAEWLDVNRYFNSHQKAFNQDTNVQMLKPSLASPPDTIRLRFEVTDADGLYQAQLYKPFGKNPSVIACTRVTGNKATVEFLTTQLIGGNWIVLRVMDLHGNFTEHSFQIDVAPLLPPPEDISIPDSNLAAAIRETLGLASGEAITDLAMLRLDLLRLRDRQITDLTGIEHATNINAILALTLFEDTQITDITPLAKLTKLAVLNIRGGRISDISPLAGLTNLRHLNIDSANVSEISPLAEFTSLRNLLLPNNPINDISPLAGLTNLTNLNLWGNNISDISVVAGLTKLTYLNLGGNDISNIAVVTGLTNLTNLNLWGNNISDISVVAGLTNLTFLSVGGNNISDISVVAGLTNLTYLNLGGNNISDISAVAGLTNLTYLHLWDNNISDISVVAGLTNLTFLSVGDINISNIAVVAGLTKLTSLNLWGNNISDISVVAGLTKLTSLELGGNNISDISPLVENTGLGSGDEVYILGNPLSYSSIYTHIPVLQERGVEVFFDNRTPQRIRIVSGNDQQGLPGAALEKPLIVEVRDQSGDPLPGVQVAFSVSIGGGMLSATSATTDVNGRAESTLTLGPNLGKNNVRVSVEGISQPESFTAVGIRPEFDLSLPAGISLIHVPLNVTAVDDAPLTIESMSDLYDALGGAEKVNFLVTRDAALQRWRIYFGSQNKGTSGDKALTDDLGIIAAMKDAVTIHLAGDSLGRNGNSTITLHRGTNLVGVPLRDSRIMRVSDLLSLEGIRGNVPSIFVSPQGKFVEVRRAADDGNISITGGQSFVLEARDAATVAISGNAWYNTSGTTAAPSVAVTGIEAGDVTPVLALRGSIVDEVRVWSERGRGCPAYGVWFSV